MTADTLVVVLGDSPRLPTGLGRIAGDLAAHLYTARERLGIEVLQCGWEYDRPPLAQIPWDLAVFPEIGQDWGASQVLPFIERERLRRDLTARQVVILSVWDPARCFDYRNAPYNLWGYFAIDGHNRHKAFGGPAAETVKRYHRKLAYTKYGAEVLHKVLSETVEHLPHGHHWGEQYRQAALDQCTPPAHGWRLGCVASNTPRKDLGLFFATLRWLRDAGERAYGWLHTDTMLTGAWSISELIDVYGIDSAWLEITTPPTDDFELMKLYSGCAVTLAPGRGEGFCYPIVESYAMGRAVVHVDYAGGAELTHPEGRVPADWYTEDNPYCVQRPLLRVAQVAQRCRDLAHKALADPTLAPYYAGSVAHLHWQELWPRWETWFRQGLNELRERR